MRILQLVQQPARRGAELFAAQLSSELERQSCEVRTVYLYSADPCSALERRASDVVLDRPRKSLQEKLGLDVGTLRALRVELARFRPNIVQLNGGRTVKYGSIMARVDGDSKRRFVYRNIGNLSDWVRGEVRRVAYSRLVFSGIDAAACLSERNRQTLIGEFRFKGIARVIPSGITPDHLSVGLPRSALRAELGTRPDDVVVIFVGSLTREKRIDRLLRCYSAARRQAGNLQLWVVGEGPERGAVEMAARECPSIRILGTRRDMGDLYAAADLAVLCSDTEGMPAVVLEAAYMGLPVVATHVGDLESCVVDGQSGFLVPPKSEGLLVAHIVKLAGDCESRRTLGEFGSNYVREKYLMRGLAQAYWELYEETLSRPAARQRVLGRP